MGYTTDFNGGFNISPSLQDKHANYLKAFNDIRHMKRDVEKLKNTPDPLRLAVGLPLGIEGEFFIGTSDASRGQDRSDDIIDYNTPSGQLAYGDPNHSFDTNRELIAQGKAQAGLWCGWTVESQNVENDKENGLMVFDKLVWDDTEKFYNYVEWLSYMINNFYEPWGYSLNGKVTWQGEEHGDTGIIAIIDNVIGVKDASGETFIKPNPSTHYEDVKPKELN